MSCHDIGRGMASVVDQIIELFRKNQIDVFSARKLIKACMSGVNWCDGNEYESIQTIMDNTCSCCLTQLKPGKEILYDISRLEFSVNKADSSETYCLNDTEEVAGYFVCENCLEQLIKNNSDTMTLIEAKEKCESQEAGYYFKLDDLFDLKFGRKTFEQACIEYGYELPECRN